MKVNSVREFLDAYEAEEEGFDPFYVEAPSDVWLELIATCPDMRKTVAYNKTISVEVIRQLAKDENWRVRYRIAMKRKTPADVLLGLASDPNGMVRHRVACNAKVTREVLILLIDDEWEVVRESARERLKEMGEDEESEE